MRKAKSRLVNRRTLASTAVKNCMTRNPSTFMQFFRPTFKNTSDPQKLGSMWLPIQRIRRIPDIISDANTHTYTAGLYITAYQGQI